MKKHIMPFLLASWPYLLFLLALLLELVPEGASEDMIVTGSSAFFGISILALLIGNVIYALRCKDLTAAELARWDFVIKLCHIPVYVLIFLLCLMFLIAIAVPAITMAAIVMIPGMFLFDLTMMLTSSCYGFRALRLAKKGEIVEKKWANGHMIAHCFFVADVISAFFVWRRLRKTETISAENGTE